MRRDVTFDSQGLCCAGWLYLPDNSPPGRKVPAIVMANAFSAVKEIYTDRYAEQFAAAGFAALLFDYRYSGASEGQPRNQIFPQAQVDDLRNAISWLSAQPEVDAMQIGAWGVSLGGGHAMYLAAFDRRIRAVVGVIPAINTWENFRRSMPPEMFQGFLGLLNQDRTARYQTGAVNKMPLVAPPGQPSAMPPEAYYFYTEAQSSFAPNWRNEVTIESLEKFIEYNPCDPIALVEPTPLMLIIAEHDAILPKELGLTAFARAGEPKELILLPCQHTDVYKTEPYFSQAVAGSVRWFTHYLVGDRPAVPVNADGAKSDLYRQRMHQFSEQIWNHGDMALADAVIVPNLVDHNPFPGMPSGREGFKTTVRLLRLALPDLAVKVVNLLVEGDRAVDHWEGVATHQGPFMGIPPTGKQIMLSGIGFVRFDEHDQIAERWAQFNVLDILQQLGAVPGAPAERLPYAAVPAVAAPRPADPAANKAIMRRQIEEIWNQGSLAAADELFHPQAAAPYAPQLPPGPAGVKAVAGMFRQAFPDFHMTIEDLVAAGDLVAARFRQTATHQGEFMGLPPTGKRVDFEETAVIRVADGQIIASWFEPDMLALMQQLGVGGASGAAPKE